MKKLDAKCVLLKSSGEPASEELLSVVSLHEVEGPLNTYWFGIAEVATNQGTYFRWRDGDPRPSEVLLSIQLSDGRRGKGRWLGGQTTYDSQSEVVQISFFGFTPLSVK